MSARASTHAHFQRFADHYERDAFEASAGLRYVSDLEQRIVANRLRDLDGRAVLDVGVGTGRFARALIARGAEVTGMDFSEEMLRRCAINEPRVRLIHGRVGTRLPFDDESFDDIVCIRVIKYVHDWDTAIAELRRVIRPGGRLVLEIANRRSVARWGYDDIDVRLDTIEATARLLRRNGFGEPVVDGGTRLPYRAYGWARDVRRLRVLTALETVAGRILPGAVLARSAILTCRSEPAQAGRA